jgi:hypothetical protein
MLRHSPRAPYPAQGTIDDNHFLLDARLLQLLGTSNLAHMVGEIV